MPKLNLRSAFLAFLAVGASAAEESVPRLNIQIPTVVSAMHWTEVPKIQTFNVLSQGLDPAKLKLMAVPKIEAAAPNNQKNIGAAVNKARNLFDGGKLQAESKNAGVVLSAADGPSQGALPSDAQIMQDISIGGISNSEREQKAIEQFQTVLGPNAPAPLVLKKGEAPPLNVYDRVIVQEAGKPGRHNIYVIRKGVNPDRVVVVGGHIDRVENGSHGIIDNWSGSTMVRHTFAAFKGTPTDATVVYMNFTREEEGLKGSEYWIKSLPNASRQKIVSMFNLDTEAIHNIYSLQNLSDPGLLALAMKTAQTLGVPLQEQPIYGGDSDQTSFMNAGIPAVMIYSGTEDEIFDIIHSAKDNIAAFNLGEYKQGLKLSVGVLAAMVEKPGAAPLAVSPQAAALLAKNRADMMRNAGARMKAYQEVVKARQLSASKRHSEAAAQYERAAGAYRRMVRNGSADARVLLKYAERERALAQKK